VGDAHPTLSNMATGTSSRASSPAFHTDEPVETTEYRTLSVLAIISLIFGLASPLCFGAPLLMAIPIFGAAISILALVRIAASEGTLAGRWMAIVGLVLCVGIGVAPFTRSLAIRALRTHQAKEFAEEWIKLLVAGKTENAFRLTVDATRGPAPQAPGEPAKPQANPYDTFVGLPLVKALTSAGGDASISFESTEAYEAPSFYRAMVRQKFKVTPPASQSGAQPVDVYVTMQRAKLPSEGRTRWLMTSLDDGTQPPMAH
jgi:hypothetical protein